MTSPIPAVAAYDPYVGRAVDGVRRAIADGSPVLVRLHPAGVFIPGDHENAAQLDREGLAVLITGYDDESQAFSIQNPVSATSSWLSYDEFGVAVVDSTLDFTIIISQLVISTRVTGDATEVDISMYRPGMPIVDLETIRLDDLHLDLGGGVRVDAVAVGDGIYRAGIPSDSVATAIVRAKIAGVRPLPFARSISQPVMDLARVG